MSAQIVQSYINDRDINLYVKSWLASFSSKKTRDTYGRNIRKWIDWCSINGLHPYKGVKRAQIHLIMRELEDRGYAGASRELFLAALTSWLKWLIEEDIIGSNPATNIRRPQREENVGANGMTRTESADWLSAAEDEGGYPFALACLLLFNGLRIGEIESLRIEHMSSSSYHQTIKVHGKGDRWRTAALAPITKYAVDNAIENRDRGALLLNEAGRPMTRLNATAIVKRLGRNANIDKVLSPHSLRSSFITQALNADVSIRDVQDAAGHASMTQTRRYDRARDSLNRHATYTVAQWVSGAI